MEVTDDEIEGESSDEDNILAQAGAEFMGGPGGMKRPKKKRNGLAQK